MSEIISSIDIDELTNDKRAILDRAVTRATAIVKGKIDDFNSGHPVKIIFINDPEKTIPEDGVSGFTQHSGLIYVYLNLDVCTENGIYTTICHELIHAKRFDLIPEIDSRPIGAFVAEGLAVAFEEEIKDTSVPEMFFLSTMNDRKNAEVLVEKVATDFQDRNFNWQDHYEELFFTGNPSKGLPRWAGYEIGYYLVKKYMAKTRKKASELIGEPADSFIP